MIQIFNSIKNGKYHGNGTYTYASGAKYVGEYKNGNKDGQGTYTFADGTIHHSGEWVNDKPIERKGDFYKFSTVLKSTS